MKSRNSFSRGVTAVCIILGLFFITRLFAADVPKMSKEDLQARIGNPDVIIVDVRLSGDSAGSDSKIKGAIQEDPGKVDAWMDKYPKDKTLVFYCA